MSGRASKKGLSPLLAIIIGLVVTIVAGILLAQLYFSYAATLSARPAANVEYVDAVAGAEGTGTLTINIKNIGNVPINGGTIAGNKISPCNIPSGIPPGGVRGVSCQLTDVNAGQLVNATVTINFGDGSSQVYLVSVRVRGA
ncbi:MAG: hypothetical protein QXI18_04420 [Nitrososphaerota archaeon]